jgi:26S proteasome regulatory subunit T2
MKNEWGPSLQSVLGSKEKKLGPDTASKIPAVFPTTRCRLKLSKIGRIKDYLRLEQGLAQNQERLKPNGCR